MTGALRIRDLITIVIITHNRCDELCRSLKHLKALPEQVRIIVVDNGSSDITVDVLAAEFPDVELIRSRKNLGAAGRNLGVQQVRTPYVAFCDDDTWWSPGSLKAAAALLDRHPRIAVLNANILVGPDHRPDPACQAMANSPLPYVEGVGPRLGSFMAGACIMRTDAFLQAGGYWPPFFIGSEEALLSMDILDAGHHIVFAPALTVHHWPSQRRDSRLRIALTERNAIWTAWLRLPWPLAWQRSRAALRSVSTLTRRVALALSALRGIPTVLKNRRVLQTETYTLLQYIWEHERTLNN